MNNLKKRFLLIISINLIFVFSACSLVTVKVEDSNQITPTPSATIISEKTPSPIQKTVSFSTFEVNKKYYNDVEGFVELKLNLPKLDGNYDGIAEINKYFVDKEKFFYDELPLDLLEESNLKVEGQKDNWFRSADYILEAVFGNIISMKAYLDGGAGGVSWAGIAGETFDLNTGKKLGLKDIFKANEDEYMNFIYDFVSKKIMDDINSTEGAVQDYLFDDPYSGEGYNSIRNFDPNDFYLSQTGLVVFYQKYALAIGAAGPIEFEIPYQYVSNMLAIDIKIKSNKVVDIQ